MGLFLGNWTSTGLLSVLARDHRAEEKVHTFCSLNHNTNLLCSAIQTELCHKSVLSSVLEEDETPTLCVPLRLFNVFAVL